MLTAPLTGNLGNNIMAYVITRIVADKLGYGFGFNRHPSYDYYGGMEQLSHLNLDYGHEHSCGYEDIPNGIENIWQEPTIHFDYDNGDSLDYHPYDENIWKIKDNTKLIIPCCQDARYFEGYQDKVCEWLQYKSEFKSLCEKFLADHGLFKLEDNLCVLNIRGGEYRSIPHVLLHTKYYYDAMSKMREINPDIYFIAISDDPDYVYSILPQIECFHFGISGDYYILNNAKNLILSNSSFAIMPTFTNKVIKNIMAPKFWSRHNVSTGYWSSDMWTFEKYGWKFIDRGGNIS